MLNRFPEFNNNPVHKSLGLFDTNIDAFGKAKISKDYFILSTSFTFSIDDNIWILPASIIGLEQFI